MARKKESKITTRFAKAVNQTGGLVTPVVASEYLSGFPDRIVTHPLWRGYIELKVDSNQLSKQQKAVINQLNRINPCCAFVVRYADETWTVEDSEAKVLRETNDPKRIIGLIETLVTEHVSTTIRQIIDKGSRDSADLVVT